MKKISYLGGIHADSDVYRGHDGKIPVTLAVGEAAEVSAEKAEQLAADFPGCFEIDGEVAGKRPKPAKPSDPGEPQNEDGLRAQLLDHKREELNAAAAELGIDAAEALPNKAAVVDAIIAAKSADVE